MQTTMNKHYYKENTAQYMNALFYFNKITHSGH